MTCPNCKCPECRADAVNAVLMRHVEILPRKFVPRETDDFEQHNAELLQLNQAREQWRDTEEVRG